MKKHHGRLSKYKRENMKTQRLRILTQEEVESLYARPQFTDIERRHYFSLSTEVLDFLKIEVANGRKTSTNLYFILQYGYFKAKHLFFNIRYSDVKDDVSFIITPCREGCSNRT